MIPSPYRPGFGERPAVLVGRGRILDRTDHVLRRVVIDRQPATAAMMMTGNRGMGKTVTLGMVADQAAAAGFITAQVGFDPESPNVQRLARSVAEALHPHQRAGDLWTRIRDRLARLNIEVNAGIVKVSGRLQEPRDTQQPDQRDALRDLLVDGARLALDSGHAGLSLHIDEVQTATIDQLSVIANALQDTQRHHDPTPVVVFGAGLPSTPDRLIEAASFSERFDFRTLNPLSPDEAYLALVGPSHGMGIQWDHQAASEVVAAAGGSPYLLQRMGDEIWSIASPNDPGEQITTAHAATGLEEVRQGLHGGMFAGRFRKASPFEQQMMTAMAVVVDENGTARIRDVAIQLNKDTKALSSARHGLIEKGLVEARGRGELGFTIPGFDEYVRQRAGVDRLQPDLIAMRNTVQAALPPPSTRWIGPARTDPSITRPPRPTYEPRTENRGIER